MSNDTNTNAETLQHVNKIGTAANPDFRDEIAKNNHIDSYAVSKAFKRALAHCTFFGVLSIGIFIVFALAMFSGIFYNYTRDIMTDTDKASVFISHTWSFAFGAITSISAILAMLVRNKN